MAIIGFADTDTVKARLVILTEQLADDVGALDADHASLAESHTQTAYAEILFAMSKLGYSKADVDQWAYGEAIQIDLALFFILRDLLATGGESSELIAEYDRREELKDNAFKLMNSSGEFIEPSGSGGNSTGAAIFDMEQ